MNYMKSMGKTKLWWLVIPVVLLSALLGIPGTEDVHSQEETVSLINIQVTGAYNLRPMMDELDKRGIKATIWLSADELTANCDYINDLSWKGHEIAGKYPGEIKPEMSYDEQKTEFSAILEAASRCTGQKLTGFRATMFTANEHTYQLLDEFDMQYLERSARAEMLSVYTYRPYEFEGHDFAILPMPVRCAYGRVGSLCDTSARGDLSPEELRQYMCAAIDHNIKLGEPLMLEWHPALTNPEDTEGWWAVFLAVLDYLETKRDYIKFITAQDIVDYYLLAVPAATQSPANRTFNVEISILPPYMGFVTLEKAGEGSVSIPLHENVMVPSGTEVKLTAFPASDWVFGSWKGDISIIDDTVTIAVDKDMSITAYFIPKC